MPKDLKDLLTTLPREGRVEWIAVRPERRAPMIVVECVGTEASRLES